MNLEVLMTDQLPGNNFILLAYGENYLYKLDRKNTCHYRWVCCHSQCSGYIKTSPDLTNICLLEENAHDQHPAYKKTIDDLKALMKHRVQSSDYANKMELVSSGQNNNFENIFDDVVLMIFKYLNNSDRVNLMLAYPNLLRLVQYNCLEPNIIFDVYQRCWENKYEIILQKSIQSITIRGKIDFPATTSISTRFLHKLQLMCPNINSFRFFYQNFDSQPLHYIFTFNKLKNLSIKYSRSLPYYKKQQEYFKLSDIRCLEIESITLRSCHWFEEDDMKLIFQLKKLKHLSLQGCIQLDHCIYLREMCYGVTFQNLQTLDLRDTTVNDSVLLQIYTIRSLKHLSLRKSRLMTLDRENISNYGLIHLVVDYQLNEYQVNDTNKCKLINLSVCNYRMVTDVTLTCLQWYRSLKVLDLTGTRCTMYGILQFQRRRPDVQTIYNIKKTPGNWISSDQVIILD